MFNTFESKGNISSSVHAAQIIYELRELFLFSLPPMINLKLVFFFPGFRMGQGLLLAALEALLHITVASLLIHGIRKVSVWLYVRR